MDIRETFSFEQGGDLDLTVKMHRSGTVMLKQGNDLVAISFDRVDVLIALLAAHVRTTTEEQNQ